MSKKNEWYTAKGLFQHFPQLENAKPQFEERVVLFKAKSLKEVWKIANKEGKAYVKNLAGVEFVDIIEIWNLHDQGRIKSGTEIFVSMSVNTLEPEAYMERFYPNRPEDCEATGDNHAWHNIDNKFSGCLNCQVIRKGKLRETDDGEN